MVVRTVKGLPRLVPERYLLGGVMTVWTVNGLPVLVPEAYFGSLIFL